MKTPEEIKKALAMCEDLIAGCKDCPYGEVDCRCMKSKDIDALEYIEQLEERIAIMEEGRKSGRWVDQGENPEAFMGAHKAQCSECGYEVWAAFTDQLHYCANCGAKMDGGDQDEAD